MKNKHNQEDDGERQRLLMKTDAASTNERHSIIAETRPSRSSEQHFQKRKDKENYISMDIGVPFASILEGPNSSDLFQISVLNPFPSLRTILDSDPLLSTAR